MRINPDVKNIHDFTFADFTLVGYDPHPAISARLQFSVVRARLPSALQQC
jgi:thymidylate synthase